MPHLPSRTILAAAFAAVLMSVPAWSEDPQENEAENDSAKSDSCLLVSGINGFNPIDNKHLTVDVGASKTYLITLRHLCHDLKWSEDIIYDATMSWSCTDTKDKIIVNGMSCFIDTIERVEDRKAAKELVADRNETKKEEE